MGELDDLAVGGGPVEQEFGWAEVAVKDDQGQLGVLASVLQLNAHAVEPLASGVGEETLEGDEVEYLPALVAAQHAAPGVLGHGPRGLEIAGEEGDLAAGQQDVPVLRSVTRLDTVQRGDRGVHVAGEHRGPGEAGTEQTPRLNQLDLSFAKRITVGRFKIDPKIDIFNALNTDAYFTVRSTTFSPIAAGATATGLNGSGGSYLLPSSIIQGRIIRIGLVVNF